MKYEILIFIAALALGQSCNRTNQVSSSKEDTVDDSTAIVVDDCYKDRTDQSEIKDLEATVTLIAGTLVLSNATDTKRYQACTLPKWASEGVKCKISGIVKQTFPNERRFASPFHLTDISKL